MHDRVDRQKRANAREASRPVPTEIGATTARREELIRRMGEKRGKGTEAGPLGWDDFSLLAHGLAFSARPLQLATAAVTERHSLGPRGAWILNLIANNIVYPHEIAEVFGIGRSLVTAELTRLAEARLIDSRRGTDRRRTELSLTAAGEAALAEVRSGIARTLLAGLAGYSPQDIRLCARMLKDLRTASDRFADAALWRSAADFAPQSGQSAG